MLPVQFLAHLSVEDVSNFVYIIGQVCLGAHEERVSSGVGLSSTSCQAAQCLVDVEQRDVGVLGTLAQMVGCLPLATHVRVMDEHLIEERRLNYLSWSAILRCIKLHAYM